MWLTLLGLLGVLVGVGAVLLGAHFQRWLQGWAQAPVQRGFRRIVFAMAFFVVLVPAELAGVNPLGAADNTPGVVYVLGLIAGIFGTVVLRRRQRGR
jgi:hypothetical protein